MAELIAEADALLTGGHLDVTSMKALFEVAGPEGQSAARRRLPVDRAGVAGPRHQREGRPPHGGRQPGLPWPDPGDGFRLRVYRLADHPLTKGIFGRIFRTTTMMINVLAEEPTPRDPLKLSPHTHDDFEQLSVAVKGEFMHHIQYPWGPDSTQWRPEDHGRLGVPSVCVIPPPTVHTTQGVGPHQQLIDMFSPPRYDFSFKPNWIRNAADYPMPL